MTVCGVTSELCGGYNKHIFSCWQNTGIILIYQKYFKTTKQAQLCKSQNKIIKILYLKLLYH